MSLRSLVEVVLLNPNIMLKSLDITGKMINLHIRFLIDLMQYHIFLKNSTRGPKYRFTMPRILFEKKSNFNQSQM